MMPATFPQDLVAPKIQRLQHYDPHPAIGDDVLAKIESLSPIVAYAAIAGIVTTLRPWQELPPGEQVAFHGHYTCNSCAGNDQGQSFDFNQFYII
jgi:hypothetical protein